MSLLRIAIAPLFAVLILGPAAVAVAAPQILGVIAGAEPAPLICRGATCSLYLSSFCLQQEREPPAPGTVYHPATNGGAPNLVITTPDGGTLRLPADRHVRFTSYGGYTSVRASVPRSEIERLGGVAAALEIGPAAALVPVPVAGDPNPLSEAEIALATGPLRAAAEAVIETAGRSPEAQGARLLGVLINALPEVGRADTRTRDGVWARVARASVPAGMSPAAVDVARTAYGVCRGFTRGRSQEPLRRCLERKHDDWLMDINQDYWDSLAGW